MQTNFFYDPQKSGYSPLLWKTLGVAPTVNSSLILGQNAWITSVPDFSEGEFTFYLQFPSDPATGQDKEIGLTVNSLGNSLFFQITDDKFYAEADSLASGQNLIEVPWISDWTQVAYPFKIIWRGSVAEFYTSPNGYQFTKVATFNNLQAPTTPMGFFAYNGNAEDFKIISIEARGTNMFSGFLGTEVASPSTLKAGSKTVTAAGTAEQLGSLDCKTVYIKATSANTGNVYIGDSTVDKTTSQQIVLAAGQAVEFDISNLGSVYVDADNNAEGVEYLAFS